jgi:hypothetical protein
MERSEVLDMMSGLKLYGMRSAYDETLATALKRKHEPQRFVGDLLAYAAIAQCHSQTASARSSRDGPTSDRGPPPCSARALSPGRLPACWRPPADTSRTAWSEIMQKLLGCDWSLP